MAPKNQPMMVVDDSSDNDLHFTVQDDAPKTADSADDELPFVYDEEMPNLVPAFEGHGKGRAAKDKIVEQVLQDFDNAWESTEPRRKKTAENWKFFAGDLPPKKWPFEGCANAHVPVMFKALTRITFRAFDEIFGEWNGFYTVLPVGPEDEKQANILTKHGNWQLREVVSDFYRQQMRAMLLYFATGDVVCHSYWDEAENRPVHEVLTGEDFVVPYVHVSTRPDYSDVPFRVKIVQKHRHELSPMRSVWSNVDKILDREHASLDDDPEMLWREAAARTQGVEIPDDQRAAPYKLLWYEGWTEHLPGQDKPRFIQCILEYASHQVLCLRIHEEPDWQEKRRYEMQMADLASYTTQLGEYNQQKQQMDGQRQQLMAMQQAGAVDDPIAHQEQVDQLDPTNLEPVIPPTWMQDPLNIDPVTGMPAETPKKPRKVAIHTFTHGVCVEPIVGNIGMGYGDMLGDYNKAANVATSQYFDQVTLGNSWGIITAGIEFERPLSFGPGKVNVAKGVTGAQLKDAIHELRPQGGNPQMKEVIEMIDGWSEQAAQAPGVLSGESGKSGETYRGISARLEQATKQLSVPTRIYAETFLKQILKNNGWLNSVFMADEEIVSVNNYMIGQAEELKLGRKLYERDYRVQIVADLRFASRVQRIAEADELVQMPSMIPPLQQNIPFIQYALKKAFEARGRWDLIPYLGPQQPAPDTPLGLPPPAPPPPPGMPPGAAPPDQQQQPMQGPPPQ